MAVTNDHRDVECILNVTKSVIYQHVRTALYPSLLQRIVVCRMVFSAGFCNIKFMLVNFVVSTAKGFLFRTRIKHVVRIAVAARSKAWVCGRHWLLGTVGLNPVFRMDVSLF